MAVKVSKESALCVARHPLSRFCAAGQECRGRNARKRLVHWPARTDTTLNAGIVSGGSPAAANENRTIRNQKKPTGKEKQNGRKWQARRYDRQQ